MRCWLQAMKFRDVSPADNMHPWQIASLVIIGTPIFIISTFFLGDDKNVSLLESQ